MSLEDDESDDMPGLQAISDSDDSDAEGLCEEEDCGINASPDDTPKMQPTSDQDASDGEEDLLQNWPYEDI